ncbi:Structural maintenance of chromosomes protein 5 [Cyanidiococcus yangmingshanensis]|uniref:Structural maintenance of chromosomes protein 5 n=1 Tax=Cyanidiococcus yangmingshanensis TaxID=2690220 RepID=A0A7J7IER8_9RHOD|nr:Structural maintenance of chromosomes protein 5 [Cyanidiococcus yangmingshanensis]
MGRLRSAELKRRQREQGGMKASQVDANDPFAFPDDAWDAEQQLAVQTSPRRKRTRSQKRDANNAAVEATLLVGSSERAHQEHESIGPAQRAYQGVRVGAPVVKPKMNTAVKRVNDQRKRKKIPSVGLPRECHGLGPETPPSGANTPDNHEEHAEAADSAAVAERQARLINSRLCVVSAKPVSSNPESTSTRTEADSEHRAKAQTTRQGASQPPVRRVECELRESAHDVLIPASPRTASQATFLGKGSVARSTFHATANKSQHMATVLDVSHAENEDETARTSVAIPSLELGAASADCGTVDPSVSSQATIHESTLTIARDDRHGTPRNRIRKEPVAKVQTGDERAGHWRRGQLVRLRLHNFLAFDDMEIFPGKALNLVVGPNGSGKSSIVAGICIGLGGRLELLSRAPALTCYIKHGCERAQIDIELFDPNARGQRRCLSRVFSRDGRNGFTLDGVSVPKRVVDDLCAEYDIQLDNLCTFLPQERVPELIECTPIELLRHTIRAVMGSATLASFEALANREVAHTDRLQRDAADHARLAEWIRQNEALEAELRFYEERQTLLQQIENMRIYRPYCIYEICRQEAIAAREAFKTVDREYRAKCADWETTCAPLREAQQEWMGLQQEREAKKQALVDLEAAAQRHCIQMNEALARFDEANDELMRLEMDITERKRNYEGCQRKVERLESELQNLMERFGSETALDKAIEEKRRERQQVAERALQASEAIRRLEQQQLAPLQRQRQDLLTQRERLCNIRQNRLALVQRRNPHTLVLDCFRFVASQREAGRFQGQVWGPLPLEIHTKDPFHSDVLETVLSGWLEVAFVFESPEDERIVFQESQRNRWRINTITLVRPDLTLTSPAPLETLQRFGVRAFLIDCFEAPANLKRALADAVPIHLIALADASANQHVRELAITHRVFAIFTPQNGYRSRVSRYDSNEVSIRVEALHRRSGLYAMPDEHQIEQIEAQLQQVEAQIALQRSKVAEFETQEKECRVEERTLQQQVAALLEGRKQLRHAKQRLEMQQSLLASIARDLQNPEKDEAQRQRWRAEAKRWSRRYAELAATASEQLGALHEGVNSLTQLTWRSLDKQRLLGAGERSLAAAALAMQTLVQRREEARQQLEAAKARMRQKRQEAEAVAPLTDQLLGQLREWQFPESVEELDERIARAQARADALTTVSADVVQTFERRQRQIEALRQRLERARQQNADEQQSLRHEREDWVRKLRTLARSISSVFSGLLRRLDCSGQIDLIEDTELRRFGLRIQVKFRAAEPLRELSAHHHSGGEKMVATMLYLLAMQEQARPPLRVIDEMNQGMDPNNERAILQMTMESSEKADMPQTLLISPKLLLDLNYAPQMVLHCVLNGPCMSLDATQPSR